MTGSMRKTKSIVYECKKVYGWHKVCEKEKVRYMNVKKYTNNKRGTNVVKYMNTKKYTNIEKYANVKKYTHVKISANGKKHDNVWKSMQMITSVQIRKVMWIGRITQLGKVIQIYFETIQMCTA